MQINFFCAGLFEPARIFHEANDVFIFHVLPCLSAPPKYYPLVCLFSGFELRANEAPCVAVRAS